MSTSATSGPVGEDDREPGRSVGRRLQLVSYRSEVIAERLADVGVVLHQHDPKQRASWLGGLGASMVPAVRAASGSRTANSLPRLRPSLCAVTDPPCSSTRLLTSVRPMPRPPCARSRDDSACTNISKIRSSISGAMPIRCR